jgi:hypothetical protein
MLVGSQEDWAKKKVDKELVIAVVEAFISPFFLFTGITWDF